MFKRLISLILPIFFSILCQVNVNADECDEGSWNQILLDNKDYHYETPFLKEKNDIGIFFDFEWNSKLKKIIIKRDKDNYPITRFSLFNKKDIKNGSVIKYFNNEDPNINNLDLDLSKLNDYEIKQKFSEKNISIIELGNGKRIILEPYTYKLNDFKLTNFELNSIQSIDSTKGAIEVTFQSFIENNRQLIEQLSATQQSKLHRHSY